MARVCEIKSAEEDFGSLLCVAFSVGFGLVHLEFCDKDAVTMLEDAAENTCLQMDEHM